MQVAEEREAGAADEERPVPVPASGAGPVVVGDAGQQHQQGQQKKQQKQPRHQHHHQQEQDFQQQYSALAPALAPVPFPAAPAGPAAHHANPIGGHHSHNTRRRQKRRLFPFRRRPVDDNAQANAIGAGAAAVADGAAAHGVARSGSGESQEWQREVGLGPGERMAAGLSSVTAGAAAGAVAPPLLPLSLANLAPVIRSLSVPPSPPSTRSSPYPTYSSPQTLHALLLVLAASLALASLVGGVRGVGRGVGWWRAGGGIRWGVFRRRTEGGKVEGEGEGGMKESKSEASLASQASTLYPGFSNVSLAHPSSAPSFPPTLKPPPYIRPFLSPLLLHPLPFFSNLTLSHAFLLLVYTLLIALFTFYAAPPASDPLRAGVIALGQVPLAVLLGCKSSPLALALLGKGAERVNFLHRAVGRLIFGGSTLHAAVYFHKWAKADISFATKTQTPVFVSAFIAYMALCVVAIASVPVIRRRAFELFVVCHWVGFMVFLIALMWHAPLCVPISLASLVLYTLDQLHRLLLKKSLRPLSATLTALEDGETTVLEVRGVVGGWRAGAWVYVRVLPGTGMGLGKAFEKHPFTIGSAPASADDGAAPGLRLFIKSTGPASGWTSSLHALALSLASDHHRGLISQPAVQILLEGPYGGPGNVSFEAVEGVCFVVGGSGISAALGLAGGLKEARASGGARARQVDLHWAIPTSAKLDAFLPYLLPLLDVPSSSSTTIHVYITRPSPAAESKPAISPHPQLKVIYGRPDLPSLVDSTIDTLVRSLNSSSSSSSTSGASRPSGLLFAVCGPEGMVAGLREAVGGLGPGRARSCGGCELFTETFGL